jgi:hypothetical protein
VPLTFDPDGRPHGYWSNPYGGPWPYVRLHWHWNPTQELAGQLESGRWRGDGCPPECGTLDPRGWSCGIEGDERPPRQSRPPRDMERRIDAWLDERIAGHARAARS